MLNVNLTGAAAPNPENAFIASLKNGYHQLINSISVEISSNAANFLFCVKAIPFGGLIFGLRMYPCKVYDISDHILTLKLF